MLDFMWYGIQGKKDVDKQFLATEQNVFQEKMFAFLMKIG